MSILLVKISKIYVKMLIVALVDTLKGYERAKMLIKRPET